jgi:membrane associated rhomboid family serine protease
MGIYDREYYRDDRPGFAVRPPQTVVGWLMVINIALWLINSLIFGERNLWLTVHLAAWSGPEGTLLHPLYWWQFLTYGFLHSNRPDHIIFNMIGLYFFGREIEQVYGRWEFLRLYLATIVFGGIVWAVGEWAMGGDATAAAIWAAAIGKAGVPLVGASGAITGLVILYALHFPHRTLLLFFVLPMPAWVFGLFVVGYNVYYQFTDSLSHIAYIVHIAGALFAFLYYRMGWNLGRLVPSSLFARIGRPRLRVHADEEDGEDGENGDQNLAAEVDRILAKISREGESSLTWRERRILKDASRQYQRRRRGDED